MYGALARMEHRREGAEDSREESAVATVAERVKRIPFVTIVTM